MLNTKKAFTLLICTQVYYFHIRADFLYMKMNNKTARSGVLMFLLMEQKLIKSNSRQRKFD